MLWSAQNSAKLGNAVPFQSRIRWLCLIPLGVDTIICPQMFHAGLHLRMLPRDLFSGIAIVFAGKQRQLSSSQCLPSELHNKTQRWWGLTNATYCINSSYRTKGKERHNQTWLTSNTPVDGKYILVSIWHEIPFPCSVPEYLSQSSLA